MTLTYDIFREDDLESVWLETVVGLDNARERMKVLSELKPGTYFLFDPTEGIVVQPIKKSA